MINSNVTFEKFLGPVIQLHPKWAEFTIDANDEDKLSFSNLTAEQKFSQFPDDFKLEVRSIFDSHKNLESLNHKIAVSIYNLYKITGKPYTDLKSKLELAFGKELSKSYFSKLLSAGEVLVSNPELSNTKCTEKLSMLARVNPDIRTQIANENNVASMSRNNLSKKISSYLTLVASDASESDLYENRCKELRTDITGKLKKLNECQLESVKLQLEILIDKELENQIAA